MSHRLYTPKRTTVKPKRRFAKAGILAVLLFSATFTLADATTRSNTVQPHATVTAPATTIAAGSTLTVNCLGPKETQARLSTTSFKLTCAPSSTPPTTTPPVTTVPPTTTPPTTTPPVTTTPPPTTVPSSTYPSGIAPAAVPSGQSQIFFDNFTGTTVNTSNWYSQFYEGAPGGTDGYWLPSHVVVSGGLLNLLMYPDKASGDSADNYWTGGGIQSPFLFKPGDSVYVDMRGDGYTDVSDIALLIGNANWPPEIDFVETSPTSSTVDGFTASAHYGSGNSQVQVNSPKVDMTTWNVWGVQWGKTSISYTLNGKVWATVAIPSAGQSTTQANSLEQPQVLSLQTQTGDPGTPAANSAVTASNPERMQVDWVQAFGPSN